MSDNTRRVPHHSIRDMALLAVPMTQGGDVLFPGGRHVMSLHGKDMAARLKQISESEPPQFAYLPLNAWGDPAPVGTVAILDDLELNQQMDEAKLLCTGVERFRVLHLGDGMKRARVEVFHDEPPVEAEEEDLQKLEHTLVDTMKHIVQLSIKISDVEDEAKQTALAQTLKRVEAFCGTHQDPDPRELLQHWIFDLSPQLRRELLSFVVIDLVSISFMDRRSLMMSTNTANRLSEALRCLQPFVKELAAKGAIVSALGNNISDDVGPTSSSSSSPS